MQIIIGKKNKKKPSPQTPTPTTASTEVGSFVATRLHKYEDEIPQIGRVIAIDGMDVTLEWWIGRYSSTWTVWKTNGTANTEVIPKNAILQTLELTKSQRLHKKDIEGLKKSIQ